MRPAETAMRGAFAFFFAARARALACPPVSLARANDCADFSKKSIAKCESPCSAYLPVTS